MPAACKICPSVTPVNPPHGPEPFRGTRGNFALADKDLGVAKQARTSGMVPVQVGQEDGGDVLRIQSQGLKAARNDLRPPAGVEAHQAVRGLQDIEIDATVADRPHRAEDRAGVEQAGEEQTPDHAMTCRDGVFYFVGGCSSWLEFGRGPIG